MTTVTSKDGTTIGYTATGDGPPLVLVDGAMCHRGMGPSQAIAATLADRFTVHSYDRRGRGESGDTPPYAVDREVDDLRAVIEAAGGSAYVFGQSSGAALALRAANDGLPIRRLAVYEAPFIVDDSHAPNDYADLIARTEALVAQGRRADAVSLFLRTVGVPAIGVRLMRLLPAFRTMTATAHTLAYDYRCLGDTGTGRPLPADAYAAITVPTLVMAGGRSPAYMRAGNRQIADRVPGARHRELPGQTHMLKAQAVRPALVEFFGD